jgi:hypothetical protein
MIYNKENDEYYVRPTSHTNLCDVTEWCYQHFGPHYIKNQQEGIWSFCHGDYYGVERDEFKNSVFAILDNRQYYMFKNETDAFIFMIRWC